MHVCECFLHLGRGEHIDVLQSEGLQDVLEEVVIQSQAAGTLNKHASPIDVDAVFPGFAGLVDEGLGEVFPGVARELI